MHDIPLNDTQRIFADKNHNLVYKFLHEKNLPASEYPLQKRYCTRKQL